MKKTSKIIESKKPYNIEIVINNTALIKAHTGERTLLNIKTNEIVGEFGDFYTEYNKEDQIFIQYYEHNTPNEKIRIYDAKTEQMIVDNWSFTTYESYCKLYILQSPTTRKYHIYDKSISKNFENIFELEFDDIQKLYNEPLKIFFKITKNNKKGIYANGQGIITPIEFDDIQEVGEIIVFTKNNNKYFIGKNKLKRANEIIETLTPYESIKVEQPDNHTKFIYAKTGNEISVFSEKQGKELFRINCDDISYFKETRDKNGVLQHLFLIKKNNKYGIIAEKIETTQTKILVNRTVTGYTTLANPIYDEITIENNHIILRKDNKTEHLIQHNKKFIKFENNYDKIVQYAYGYYLLYKNNYCDIIQIDNNGNRNLIIYQCEIIDTDKQIIVYKKSNKYGVLTWIDKYQKAKNTYGFDNIEHFKGSEFFIIEQNGKKGLWYSDYQHSDYRGNYEENTIIEPKYKSISSYFYKAFFSYDSKHYLCLENENKIFELSCIDGYGKFKRNVEVEGNKFYKKICFYENFMVLYTINNTYIYSYNPEKGILQKFPPRTIVTPAEQENQLPDDIEIYRVNDKYYFYKDGKFEETYSKGYNLYITTYECDYGTIVVNSHSKNTHNEICKIIDESGEKNMSKTFPKIKKKYKDLVKKIK